MADGDGRVRGGALPVGANTISWDAIDESGNSALNDRVSELYHQWVPYTGTALLSSPEFQYQ